MDGYYPCYIKFHATVLYLQFFQQRSHETMHGGHCMAYNEIIRDRRYSGTDIVESIEGKSCRCIGAR